jgi:prevent-host-death family protein
MAVPRILSVREARSGLTQVMKDVREPGAQPVYVGAHRKPEVVIMSAEQYEQLTGQQAIDNSIASARLEGLEASERDVDLMKRVAAGELTTEQAVAIALGTDADRASA